MRLSPIVVNSKWWGGTRVRVHELKECSVSHGSLPSWKPNPAWPWLITPWVIRMAACLLSVPQRSSSKPANENITGAIAVDYHLLSVATFDQMIIIRWGLPACWSTPPPFPSSWGAIGLLSGGGGREDWKWEVCVSAVGRGAAVPQKTVRPSMWGVSFCCVSFSLAAQCRYK